jgi:hypothetical protein
VKEHEEKGRKVKGQDTEYGEGRSVDGMKKLIRKRETLIKKHKNVERGIEGEKIRGKKKGI